MQRTRAVWFGILISSLVFQVFIWSKTTLIDHDFWTSRAQYLAQDITRLPIHFDPSRHAGHPATPPLLAAATIISGGIDPEVAVRVSIAILGSIATVAVIIFIQKAFPHDTKWFVFTAGMLISNRFLVRSNIADAFAMPMIALFFLALLPVLQQPRHKNSSLAIAAFAAGLALATRIHVALPILVPVFLLLFICIPFRKALSVLLGAVCIWYVFTPIAWATPVRYIQYALIGESAHVFGEHVVIEQPNSIVHIPFTDIVRESPMTFIGIILAAYFLYGNQKHPKLLTWFLAIFLISTVLLIAVLQVSHIESLRYYYPLFFTWEIFSLPLLRPLFSSITNHSRISQRFITSAYIALFIAGNTIMLVTTI